MSVFGFEKAFPREFQADVEYIRQRLYHKKVIINRLLDHSDMCHYKQRGVDIKFPYRIYWNKLDLDFLNECNPRQQVILHCMYTRHHDGHERHWHARALIASENYWVIPYLAKLSDEYVLAIIQDMYASLEDTNSKEFAHFWSENKEQLRTSYDRMVSYWNEYHRWKYKDLKKYPGKMLFDYHFSKLDKD
ncbi:hypothetical protein FLK61_27415 [Paenalkalicoccus suaedae]|uniref:Uncharacterized protein n=1 Tax=Paenalkalicoccus suaedae TaxID=2592382 RepID=A0A859FE23_9BACI|nr:hypothetical protein [Paenalkalicoccus suaedae]QKS70485.1 hypothetical protein FLK61_27415 [Paenalkalicoccus suaedae]